MESLTNKADCGAFLRYDRTESHDNRFSRKGIYTAEAKQVKTGENKSAEKKNEAGEG